MALCGFGFRHRLDALDPLLNLGFDHATSVVGLLRRDGELGVEPNLAVTFYARKLDNVHIRQLGRGVGPTVGAPRVFALPVEAVLLTVRRANVLELTTAIFVLHFDLEVESAVHPKIVKDAV